LGIQKRISYIDSLRSVAIIMVLEGHFITQSLKTEYRDDSQTVYQIWKFTRCLTAPTFLFISGLIFTYLLLKNKATGFTNKRLQKGSLRAFKLIGLGYLLQLNLYSYFKLGKPLITDLFQIFHILQCIGTSLLVVIILYLIKSYLIKIPLGVFTFLMGFIFFAGSPTLHQLDFKQLPQFLENMLVVSKTYQKSSIFPLFHWAGFVMFGASLGAIFYKSKNFIHSYILPLSLCGIGLIFKNYYTNFLNKIYLSYNFPKYIVDFSYVFEFKRLGQVLIAIGVFIFIHKISHFLKPIFKYVPWSQNLFIKMGQNTLSIFVVHVIILYQGFWGWKINELTRKKLTPLQSIFGAILFITFFVLWIKYLEKIKKIIFKIYTKTNSYHTNKKRGQRIVTYKNV